MKKKICLGLVVCLLVSLLASFACAETKVPSKTTQDMTRVVSAVGLVVDVPVPTEHATACLANISAIVAEKGSVIAVFDENVQAQIAALLPEGFDLETLVMNEFIPFTVVSYEPGQGEYHVQLEFATVYEDGTPLVVVVGVFTGLDENGQPVYEWYALKAVAVDGGIDVTIPEEIIAKLQGQELVLGVLSESKDESAAVTVE